MKFPCQWGFILGLTILSCMAHSNDDFMHAEALWEENNFKDAITFYNKAIGSGKLNENELASSYYNVATFFFMNFKPEESIRIANEVLKIQPNHTGYLSLRALA
ncbi:exported hypothetical protein [uncultured Desulfobacterium sp.]|uniref:Uncharacterized protein n=1 Tax=uncultured Desulfobacterium sp. TaxID=201089 RepID=A0A445N129_9BACT|nr:exported hypothetical protein [uncultured Desulfobacterium sp.]